MVTIVAFILILGLLILVHEFGHFWVARRAGIAVEEFAIGFPPRLWSWVRRGTKYSLNLIPFGGFVRMAGEREIGAAEAPAGERPAGISLSEASRPRRALVMVAGVTMNYVLGIVLLTIGFMVGLPQVVDDPVTSGVRDVSIQVASVAADSPAASAGVLPGDRILAVDGRSFASLSELQAYVAAHGDSPLAVQLGRGDELLERTITPQPLAESEGKAVMGVGLMHIGRVAVSWWKAPWYGFRATNSLIAAIVSGLGDIIGKLVSGQGSQVDVAGPIGVAVLTGQAVALGWLYVLQFVAVLSINLAVINILPIPALDGGRLLLLAVEGIRRRALSEKFEAAVHRFGFSALIALMLLIVLVDVRRFGSGIWQAVRGLFG